MLRSFLATLTLFAGGCLATPLAKLQSKSDLLQPGRHVIEVMQGSVKRNYIVRIPAKAQGKATPVVMVLHGWTGSAVAAESYTGMAAKAEQEGFIAVFPDGVGKPQGWNAGFINLTGKPEVDDLGFLTQVLDDVSKRVNADPDRIFVCGHSNGAMMTHALAVRLGERLAACAAVAGTVGVGTRALPEPKTAVPMLLIHGRSDKTVAYDPAERNAMLLGVGAVDSAKWWAGKNGAKLEAERSEKGKIITDRWTGRSKRQQVELVTILDFGHDWPGGLTRDSEGKVVPETASGVRAADLIWEFFKAHPRKG